MEEEYRASTLHPDSNAPEPSGEAQPTRQRKRYRVKDDFLLREIAGEAILVPVGKSAEQLNGMLSLNGTFCFLWKLFQEPRTIQEAVLAAAEQYDGAAEQMERDITDFVGESLRQGFMNEEDM